MSSVGFISQRKKEGVEKLREAWRSLNDVLRNLRNAEAALIERDNNLICRSFAVARWNVEQVKKAVAQVGQAKNQKASR
jgi:hypothetical protein